MSYLIVVASALRADFEPQARLDNKSGHCRPRRFGLDARGMFRYFAAMPKARGAENAVDEIQKLPFEEALQRLQTIVESMEAQDLPLETLLARYQEGTRLAQLCQAKLNEAELRIQQLERNAKGEPALKPAPTTEEEA